MKKSSHIDLFLQNNLSCLDSFRRSWKCRLLFLFQAKVRKLYSMCEKAATPEEKNEICTKAMNAYDNLFLQRMKYKSRCWVEDFRLWFHYHGKRKVIDYSNKKKKDYYSVVVEVKNEARYIREFILFYQETGADRIYLYDNDSEDNLMEEIEPFLKEGFVVYKRWPGKASQTAAYRDAIRNTKKRTKWLAIIDADEFLFSPKKAMPDMLREYEEYPGVGANWVMFGPSGHITSPQGLVMDNYKMTLANWNSVINCHIKSIVQPKKVSCIHHTHYARYKKGKYAVDSQRDPIDNYSAVILRTGRAFTPVSRSDVFRINHYNTKSLEDLKKKCARGYSDGTQNAKYEDLLRPYNEPLVEDHSIDFYADLVRKRMKTDENVTQKSN